MPRVLPRRAAQAVVAAVVTVLSDVALVQQNVGGGRRCCGVSAPFSAAVQCPGLLFISGVVRFHGSDIALTTGTIFSTFAEISAYFGAVLF